LSSSALMRPCSSWEGVTGTDSSLLAFAATSSKDRPMVPRRYASASVRVIRPSRSLPRAPWRCACPLRARRRPAARNTE
jgi:hypothetical protein